jgi:hypothetical protein
MKIRKQILTLLLSAFVFIVMHDFIIVKIDSDTQTELYMHKIENVTLCETSVLHELIHMSLIYVDQLSSSVNYMIDVKTLAFFEIDKTFSSHLRYRLYRPPIA